MTTILEGVGIAASLVFSVWIAIQVRRLVKFRNGIRRL